jgi:hypothetical protein
MFPQMVSRKAGSLPSNPTDALPGSEQKILIMMERAQRREQLFHPLDGPWREHSFLPDLMESKGSYPGNFSQFPEENSPSGVEKINSVEGNNSPEETVSCPWLPAAEIIQVS